MSDYHVKYYPSEFNCKICKNQMEELNSMPGYNRCKTDEYTFDYHVVNSKIYSKYEVYMINNIIISIYYLDKEIEIDYTKYNFIKFEDYELDDIEKTFSLQSIYNIVEKYKKFINIS